MKIETVTIKHPSIEKREITVLMVDNKIDEPSLRYLVYEAQYGGRGGYLAGRTSHKGKATHIAELYRNLEQMGLNWRTATEFDVKRIRNAMLCWNINDNQDYKEFPYKPIKNDSMNHKLHTWLKFYKYMQFLGEECDIVLRTKRIKRSKKYKGLLSHLNKRTGMVDEDFVEIWTLRVSSSPASLPFHALSRTEFARLRQHLRGMDIAYEALVVFMVNTGLRIDAAMEVKKNDFEGLVALLSSGLELNDATQRKYMPKGGNEPKEYDLPLWLIKEIRNIYIARERNDRLARYYDRCKRLGIDSKEEPFWILDNGKPMKKHDVWAAFKKVSKVMKRVQSPVTPHWLRHTFATWTIMDMSEKVGIPLENTGVEPSPLFVNILRQKLGHASAETTLRYIATALKLMRIDVNNGDIQISLRSFRKNKRSQELVKREAMREFGEEFSENSFDPVQYGLSRQIVVDDEFVSCK